MFGTLRANRFTDKYAIEVLMAFDATLVLSILVIMSSLGNACKDALNDDKDVKQYRPCETCENYDSCKLMRDPPVQIRKSLIWDTLNAAQISK